MEMKKIFKCPRCNLYDLKVTKSVAQCPNCGDFNERDLILLMEGEIDADSLLTIEEMTNIFRALDFDPKRHEHAFEEK